MIKDGIEYVNGDVQRLLDKTLKIVKVKDTASKIAPRAFADSMCLTEVFLPEGLEHIACEAFAGCKNLKTVHFPSTLKTIEYGAFSDCPIENINLPDSILKIAGSAFDGAKGKYDLFTLPKNLHELGFNAFEKIKVDKLYIGKKLYLYRGNAFKEVKYFYVDEKNEHFKTSGGHLYSSSLLQLIRMANNKNDILKVNIIASNAIENIKLKEFKVPETVKLIENSAFKNAKIGHLTLPASLVDVNEAAFVNLLVEEITSFASIFTVKNGALFNADDTLILYPSLSSKKEFVLPGTCLKVAPNAFVKTGVEKIIIEDGKNGVILGTNAFKSCKSIKEIIFKRAVALSINELLKETSVENLYIPEGSYLRSTNITGKINVVCAKDFYDKYADSFKGKATITCEKTLDELIKENKTFKEINNSLKLQENIGR